MAPWQPPIVYIGTQPFLCPMAKRKNTENHSISSMVDIDGPPDNELLRCDTSVRPSVRPALLRIAGAAAYPVVSGQRQSYTVDKCQSEAAPHREKNNTYTHRILSCCLALTLVSLQSGRKLQHLPRIYTGEGCTQHAPFSIANHIQNSTLSARGWNTQWQSCRERNTTTRGHKKTHTKA